MADLSTELVPWSVMLIETPEELDLLKQITQETGEVAVDTETDGLHWAIGHRPFMATFSAEDSISWACYKPEMVREFMEFLDEEGHLQVYHNAKFDNHMLRCWLDWMPADGYMGMALDDTMHGFRIQYPQHPAGLKVASARYVDSSIDIDGPQRLVRAWITANTTKERINGKWIFTHIPTYKDVPRDLMVPYATQDTYLTIKSHVGLRKDRANDAGTAKLYEREIRLVKLLIHAEKHGWPVDGELLMKNLRTAHDEYDGYQEALNTLYGEHFPDTTTPGKVNINSPNQLRKLIYEVLEEPVKHMTESGKSPATDESALADMNDRHSAELILHTRKWKRAKDKYSEIGMYMGTDGAVHGDLKPERAVTGRFGSSEPALQNVSVYKPDKAYTHTRTIFRPRKGTEWLFGDYSQVEMRIFADVSQDAFLLEAIRTGQDLHSITASRMYGEDIPPGDQCNKDQKAKRSFGKLINFTIIYGGGKKKIAESLMYGSAQNDAVDPDEARRALVAFNPVVSERLLSSPFEPLAAELLRVYREGFPQVPAFIKQVQAVVRSRAYNEGGGYVRNVFGRLTPVGSEATHVAVNYIVQGTAADLMKSAMLSGWDATVEYCKLHGLEPWSDVHLFMTIHDEMIWSVPSGHAEGLARYIKKSLTDWPQFSVPIDIDFAYVTDAGSWAQKKGLKV